MQNGQTDPGVLVARVRSEVRKRKLALDLEAPAPAEPEPPVVAAIHNVPEIVAPLEGLPPSASARVFEKPRLKHAQAAVGRALLKNESARGWPRFLRGIRRNQETINDSLIRAVRALLETLEWLRNHFTLFEREQRDRSQEQQ